VNAIKRVVTSVTFSLDGGGQGLELLDVDADRAGRRGVLRLPWRAMGRVFAPLTKKSVCKVCAVVSHSARTISLRG